MNYKIIISETSKHDLRDIYEYIAFNLKVPQTAKNTIDKILVAIEDLALFPEKHMLYPKDPMYSNNIRFFSVSNYIIFYKVDESSVYVSRIIYGGRNITEHNIT